MIESLRFYQPLKNWGTRKKQKASISAGYSQFSVPHSQLQIKSEGLLQNTRLTRVSTLIPVPNTTPYILHIYEQAKALLNICWSYISAREKTTTKKSLCSRNFQHQRVKKILSSNLKSIFKFFCRRILETSQQERIWIRAKIPKYFQLQESCFVAEYHRRFKMGATKDNTINIRFPLEIYNNN